MCWEVERVQTAENDEWRGYTLVAGRGVDEFVIILQRYAKDRGVDVVPGEASKPDGRRIVNLLWPAQGSAGYWPLCRVNVIPWESSRKSMVEVDPATFARRPKGQRIAKELWLGFPKYLEDLEIEVNMAELTGASLDYLGTTEQAEPQVESAAVAEQLTPAEDEGGKVEIFYAYAREDEDLRDELEKHLRMLEREGVITNWHDRKIGAGEEWEGQIDTHLNTARVILLLVSPDFIDSDYCWDVEVKRAMERHKAGKARVIPIILRSVDWESAPFGKLQALPTDAKPVTIWANQDEAFLDVARGIRAAVTELRAKDNDSNPNH